MMEDKETAGNKLFWACGSRVTPTYSVFEVQVRKMELSCEITEVDWFKSACDSHLPRQTDSSASRQV